MQKGYLEIVISSILWMTPFLSQAQGGPHVVEPLQCTKIVRGCLYEVVPGLAEITKIAVDKPAEESLLHYKEHKVMFKFTPMGSAELLPCLEERELEFMLRSNVTQIPVGPQYIQQKGIKVGTKYAMNILQTKNQKACLEQYTYESKALDNDLFEAAAQIIPFVKGSYPKTLATNNTATELEDCLSTETEALSNLIRDLGLNEDSLRTVIRTSLLEEHKGNFVPKEKKTSSKTYVSKTAAFKKARKIAKEKVRQEQLEKQQALVKEKERNLKLKTLREALEAEIELEIKLEK